MERIIHQGRNVKRFREMFGIKQENLAYELGEDWNQRKVSLLEAKEFIENDTLEKVASILKIPSEAIKCMDDQTAISLIAGTINNHDQASLNFNSSINYAERWLDAIAEIKQLYERIIAEKESIISMLKKNRKSSAQY